ncbi:hypothetical protein MSIBF_A4600001 [groundwater metagenome]|uniref:Uncharacterized protein n=1 Tax=groundwater metagenome TaxID=717931 RepID=A0A098ECN0_9ZZZZ
MNLSTFYTQSTIHQSASISVKSQQIDYNLNFNYDSTGCKGITKNEPLLL